MKLAIYGGTFDPIHDAHLAAARLAAERFALERVLFVPAAQPPHKTAGARAPYQDRLRMVELACAGEPRFEASRLEERAARSYSIETLERVRANLAPADELFFIIGADAFAEIHTWWRWQEVLRAVRFLVVSRPGHEYHVPPGARVDRLDELDSKISSSDIRAALAAGREPEGAPRAVREYIAARGLYNGCAT